MILSEQEQIRRNSLEELRKLGINPYPAAEYKKMLMPAIYWQITLPKKTISRRFASPAV